MKVLVATKITQGRRRNDFCHAADDELVGFPSFECDREEVDGTCGCRRSFSGLTSRRATTTAIVVDRPDLDQAALAAAVLESYKSGGWGSTMSAEELQKTAAEEAAELARIAGVFALGAVVERRGDQIQARLARVK